MGGKPLLAVTLPPPLSAEFSALGAECRTHNDLVPVEIEPTTSRGYSNTLVPLNHD